MVAACRGVAEARRDSGREARFRASGGYSVRGEDSEPMKKFMSGLAIAAIASTAFVGAASAQRNADAGNGGVSTSNSNGGPVTVGSTNTGNVSGSTTVVDPAGLVGTDDLAATIILAVLGATEAE